MLLRSPKIIDNLDRVSELGNPDMFGLVVFRTLGAVETIARQLQGNMCKK